MTAEDLARAFPLADPDRRHTWAHAGLRWFTDHHDALAVPDEPAPDGWTPIATDPDYLPDAIRRTAVESADRAALVAWALPGCEVCRGTCTVPCPATGDHRPGPCSECAGSGKVECECPNCEDVHDRPCPACKGIESRRQPCPCRGTKSVPCGCVGRPVYVQIGPCVVDARRLASLLAALDGDSVAVGASDALAPLVLRGATRNAVLMPVDHASPARTWGAP